jgi:hypothetical protein
MLNSDDTRPATRLLTLLELAESTCLPKWGPSVGSDIQIDEPAGNVGLHPTGFHAAWGPSVGTDIEFDEPPSTGVYLALGPSVGDDVPRGADGTSTAKAN